MVTGNIAQLRTCTLPVVVIKSKYIFPLLALVRYLLSFTSYLTRYSCSGNIDLYVIRYGTKRTHVLQNILKIRKKDMVYLW